MQDNLSQYGHTFQTKVVTSLLNDRAFLQQVSDIVEPNYFESQANSWVVEKIMSYYEKYKTAPTAEVFKSELITVEDKVLKSTIADALKESAKYKDSSDAEYVKSTTLEFCKNQKIVYLPVGMLLMILQTVVWLKVSWVLSLLLPVVVSLGDWLVLLLKQLKPVRELCITHLNLISFMLLVDLMLYLQKLIFKI